MFKINPYLGKKPNNSFNVVKLTTQTIKKPGCLHPKAVNIKKGFWRSWIKFKNNNSRKVSFSNRLLIIMKIKEHPAAYHFHLRCIFSIVNNRPIILE